MDVVCKQGFRRGGSFVRDVSSYAAGDYLFSLPASRGKAIRMAKEFVEWSKSIIAAAESED